MKGKQRGRPTKWVSASIGGDVPIGKPGITFEVWKKWKRTRKKLGTLTVSVGGIRWWPINAPKARTRSWDKLADLLDTKSI